MQERENNMGEEQPNADILVMDTTAVIGGLNINVLRTQNPQLEIRMTTAIFEEAQRHKAAQTWLEIAVSQNILRIQDPNSDYTIEVEKKARTMGDLRSLSANDKSLIALALELRSQYPDKRIQVMSDDYSIQNTCTSLKIPIYKLRKAGIKKAIKWEIYCPDCFRTYSPDKFKEDCDYCGTELKRRPFKGKRPHL
jgi:UPF0271 protein